MSNNASDNTRKYQVFISSTWEDLIDERKEVIETLWKTNCIPSAMEQFPATEGDKWEFIKSRIDECDYFIIIVAGRYGSCDNEGLSFTEKEYNYAESIKKPILRFIHKDSDKLTGNKIESTDAGKEKLEKFKKKLKNGQLVNDWEDKHELSKKMILSIFELNKNYPEAGWIRSNTVTKPEDYILYLEENKKLNETLCYLNEKLKKAENNIKIEENVSDLSSNDDTHTEEIVVFKEEWQLENLNFTWNEVLFRFKSAFITGIFESSLFDKIKKWILEKTYSDKVTDESVEKILNIVVNQFYALNIVDYEKIETNGYNLLKWTITPNGLKKVKYSLAIKKK